MQLHEYQAKEVFAEEGIPSPVSQVAESVDQAVEAAESIGYPVAIKAQVHVGSRGNAGGIQLAGDKTELKEVADEILGMVLKGYPVERVLVEEAVDFVEELYVSITTDREAGHPIAMISTRGGVDIEEVVEQNPEAIVREVIDPAFGLQSYQANRAVYKAGVDEAVADDVARILQQLYSIWNDTDAEDAEINPLMITADGDIVAADAVLNVDSNAEFRQPEMAAYAEEGETTKDELEVKADEHGFEYVRLDGNIGLIGNGAGLGMATLDLVDYYGGSPANFLDLLGGAQEERIGNALDTVFSDENVDVVLFNIFGGITRCDKVASGINQALREFETIPTPVVVRLAGTNAEEGKETLDKDLVTVEDTLEDAIQQAVKAVSRVKA